MNKKEIIETIHTWISSRVIKEEMKYNNEPGRECGIKWEEECAEKLSEDIVDFVIYNYNNKL